MKSKFKLVQCELDGDWDNFINQSPNGAAFFQSDFVHNLGVPYHAYYCCKGNEKFAAILLITNSEGNAIVGHHDVIYDGIVHRDTKHLNTAQSHSEQFSVQETIAEFLAHSYNSVYLKLHPSILDIRSFLWVNYHNAGPTYTAIPRYTTCINISEFADEFISLENSQNYLNSSVSRRQEIRYGIKKGVVATQSSQFDTFAQYYSLTMARQNIHIDQPAIEQLALQIKNLAQCGRLIMFEAKTQSGETGSFATFLLHKDTAYYYYGANKPDMRDSHTGTAVIWQAMPVLAGLGIKKIDLEGINSPQRGWFKLSFGGDISPYFHLKLS
ncbi:GNAT family N-acetyltransferase [Pseudoalteromonas luteoviolacea]|uniref:BioF2-like acetyltransferase domain-containing protein n=1 Tax=Pseudoalteromonas luteoviolacea H33 TaxID=1365251 RepID=A0A167C3K8_9GAMM|nr:GNAT family N-acetyltransferase [Pseudoalteromonas luteoviolacea]KZN47197.1 hypothetical protein N476_23750 [Pseudoalteromonas luteoviolacea H33]KZN77187.1 hypothetical protein N477_12440 [Pseudoalteromonas luteoviolacea H33-S]MBQ4879340.1 GNAT family N-acetyltransferase [Pseudoalteromonas luteoviolacea]MBQ4908400.1 GNAT family N-acetyltransferase [Pseudoalteromonas luteoviolacea]